MLQNIRLVILLMAAWLSVHAQDYSYHELPTQKLLPVANVNAVMQDSEGYMWYGTSGGGICSDDGYTVTAYNSATSGKGVMENDEVTCMAEDHQGKIWFGTRAGTYYINKGDRTVHRVVSEHTGQRKVNCIGVTNDGSVWVGIEQDIIKFSPEGKCLKTLSIGNNKREEAKEMTVDSKGTLWVTILRGGIVTINPRTDQLTHQPWDYPSAASYLLEDTVRHCYWVGTWGGGIVRYPDMVAEPATIVSTENQHFGSEVYNLWIDHTRRLMWVATMDDVYAYELQSTPSPHLLSGHDTRQVMPAGKKLINKLVADRRGNLWVPGYSPHTFILARGSSSGRIRRDEVRTMTEQMGYKVMVNKIACEGDYYWIYQNRTRLSLYHAPTGQLSFMATDARPTPLSTQRPMSRCQSDRGVWTCNGRRLIHAWHEGMTICWEEVEDAHLPNYISALSDEGNGRLLIGTEKQVFLFDYRKRRLTQLTDSVGIVRQVSYAKDGTLQFSTDPQALPSVTDRHGHLWTLSELTLKELNPKTGAYRLLHASDKDINMDYLTDLTLSGDSVCLGGIGAFCMIGRCTDLDVPHPGDSIIVTHYDSLKSISVSTMNHLHTHDIQFAYRFAPSAEWTLLPPGANTIDLSHLRHGRYTLQVKATDEYGVWHEPQTVWQFSIPRPWYLRWYLWGIPLGLIAGIVYGWLKRRKSVEETTPTPPAVPQEAAAHAEAEQDAPENPFFEQVRKCVEQNLDNTEYGVDDLSRDLGMSRMNMYRKFQSLSSVTPSEFIRNHRLQKAAHLLRSTDESVTEIAYEVGFTSPQYFAKCFKDMYHLTPKQWRAEN